MAAGHLTTELSPKLQIDTAHAVCTGNFLRISCVGECVDEDNGRRILSQWWLLLLLLLIMMVTVICVCL